MMFSTGKDQPIHNFIHKDYKSLQYDKELFKRKKRDAEAAQHKLEKEQNRKHTDEANIRRLKIIKHLSSIIYVVILFNVYLCRLEDELEITIKEKEALQDKVSTTAFCLKSKEWELTNNLVNTLQILDSFFENCSQAIKSELPKIIEKVKDSKQQKVFGVDLLTHMR